MKLRQANEKDAEQIGRILKEAYKIKTVEEGKEAFVDETGRKINYIVAEENGTLVGIVSWCPHALPKHGLVELDRIAVLPEFRGNGISRGLFEQLVKDAVSYFQTRNSVLRKLFLYTHADNVQAQTFYKKMGMVHEATIPNMFYANLDEFVMSMYF